MEWLTWSCSRVVWLKFELEDDPETDDLTSETRALLEAFVQRTFADVVGSQNVSPAVLVCSPTRETMLTKGRSSGSGTGAS